MTRHLHSCLTSRSSRFLVGTFIAATAAAGSARAQLNTAVTFYPTRPVFQSAAANAGAPASNVVDFQDVTYSPATGSGFLGPFTKAGFITFTPSNFQHEIVEGTNLGQPGNNVYFTLANDKTLGVADITFAAGIFSLGFDFKDGAGNGTAGLVPQNFIFNLRSGTTSLGSMTLPTIPGGTMLTFVGFTSTLPITGLFVTSSNNTPNQDFALDNLAASNPIPEPGTALTIGLGLLGLIAGRRVVMRRTRRPEHRG